MTEAARVIFALVTLLAVLGAFGAYTFHERAVGAESELTDLKKSSADLIKKANDKIATLTKQYAETSAALEVKTDEANKAAAAAHDSDAQRLRDFNAYRSIVSKLQGTAAAIAAPSDGSGSAPKGEDFVGELGSVGLSLADALRDTVTALNACMTDRNSVTSQ